MPEIPPADVLLCERCGYRIGGLATELPCPECGKPIAESLSERRKVHPTIWQTLTRPRWSLDHMRIDDKGVETRNANIVTASIIVGLGNASIGLASITSGRVLGGLLEVALGIAIGVPACLMLLFVATAIETRGIRLFGGRRNYRIHPVLASCICGYATAGWLVGACGYCLALMMLAANILLWNLVEPPSIWLDLGRAMGMGLAIMGGFIVLVGFFFFEVFAAMGMQRCRFANQAREHPDEPIPESPGDAANPPPGDGESIPRRTETDPIIDHAATPTDPTDRDR